MNVDIAQFTFNCIMLLFMVATMWTLISMRKHLDILDKTNEELVEFNRMQIHMNNRFLSDINNLGVDIGKIKTKGDYWDD